MQPRSETNTFKLIFFCNILFLLILGTHELRAQGNIPFEQSQGQKSATLKECLQFYYDLQESNKEYVKINEPLLNEIDLKYHDAGQIKLVEITNFSNTQEKIKIFINNGIHPGEPDGIDASMILARDLMLKPELKALLNDVDLFIIPIYNTGGAQRRGCCSRANQDGPAAYGFRGNDLNLDLNRDFIKCDALETEVFEYFFHMVRPHFFIDTHVSDGADYQYTMTLIASQHNKYQNKAMEEFHQNILLPLLYSGMNVRNEEMCPYVNLENDVPDSGITAFMDGARFSSGYASMFNCFSFTAETHMLKPFSKRVRATNSLFLEFLRIASERKLELLNTFHDMDRVSGEQKKIVLRWNLDTLQFETITFKGYQPYFGISNVTGQKQLYYDRNRPTTRNIKYFNTYTPGLSVDYPKAYLIPYEWYAKLNLQRYHLNTAMIKDTTLMVGVYSNVKYTARKNPYEGNFGATVDSMQHETQLQKLEGNWVMILLKNNIRYQRFLAEALEPESPEGFFAWGKLYSFVQQKEGFSDYVWDKRAENILKNDGTLNALFLEKKKDPVFAADKNKQLDFIYRHSRYFETTYLRYPIFRIEK